MAEEHALLQGFLVSFMGLVPRYPLQKPPSRGLEGFGGEGGGAKV